MAFYTLHDDGSLIIDVSTPDHNLSLAAAKRKFIGGRTFYVYSEGYGSWCEFHPMYQTAGPRWVHTDVVPDEVKLAYMLSK